MKSLPALTFMIGSHLIKSLSPNTGFHSIEEVVVKTAIKEDNSGILKLITHFLNKHRKHIHLTYFNCFIGRL